MEWLEAGVLNERTKATLSATHILGLTAVTTKDEKVTIAEAQKLFSGSGQNTQVTGVNTSVTINFGSGDWPNESIQLDGNTTSVTFNFATAGIYRLVVEQDGTGGWSFTLPSGLLGTPPTLNTGPGDKTLYTLYHDGTDTFHA